MSLTMRVVSSGREGQVMGTGTPDQYEVNGLPDGQRAWVGKREGQWKILRETNGTQSGWNGDYPTADAALQSLEKGEHR